MQIAVNNIFQVITSELRWVMKVIFRRYIIFTILDFEIDIIMLSNRED